MTETRLLIRGEQVPGDGAPLEVENPFTEETIAAVGAPSAAQVDAAVAELKEPMGVVGCIVPWNYPLLLLAWKLAPALAAGNTAVCKPSELTPLSTLAPCLDHLPPGVVNVLAGAGETGEAIVRDERVDCIAFTGSVETGKRIARICADRVARVNLELGGKDPFIVCADVGAVVVAGGDGAGQERGHFFAPTVVTGAPRETDLLREETFGPVAPIVSVRTLDEAIELANGTRYGLGCNVWAFQETKHVHLETRIAPKEWWYPYGGAA